MKLIKTTVILAVLIMIGATINNQWFAAQELNSNPELDEQVQDFLDAHRGEWRDMNVPYRDGQLLHDIIVENNYTRALEIGTSTGLSAVWIAWALSKTGGKLITVEINESRYNEALDHFEEAGLSEYVDARLADAHELVPELEGPFDFVFSDADKDWYTNYFKAVSPKLVVGGCFTAHNVSGGRRGGGANDYYQYVSGLSNYDTSLNGQGNGVSISYKTAE